MDDQKYPVTDPGRFDADDAYEHVLRPGCFEEFPGQEKAKAELKL